MFAILIWGVTQDSFEGQINDFYLRLRSVTSDIMGCTCSLQATDVVSAVSGFQTARMQMAAMWDYFYLTGKRFLTHRDMPAVELFPLRLDGIADSLKIEIQSRNSQGCATLFERAISRVKKTEHEKSQAIWLCLEMYITICENLNIEHSDSDVFEIQSAGYEKIQSISTRDDAVHFLTAISNELQTLLSPASSRRRQLVEKIEKYIIDNCEKRITHQDVAKNVYLSPGYLTMIFKKEYGENLVPTSSTFK